MTGIRTVGFTQMKDGTKDDYLLLAEYEEAYLASTADRVMDEMHRQGTATLEGYQITRLEHGLQTATRARRDGADDDWVVAALLHDIGDALAPQNHDKMAAEILRPYVREEVTWVIEHHGLFQTYYYGHHYGWDRNARDRHRDHPCFNACAAFCERWDQASFDPAYDSASLETFEPLVHALFARPAFDPDVLRPNVVIGLP